MIGPADEAPFEALEQTDLLGAALALGSMSRRFGDAPTAIAKSLGERLAEVLPPEEFTIQVNGPVLDVKSARGYGSTGMPGMALAEAGTPEEKLARVFMEEADSLRGIITRARRQGLAEISEHGEWLPAAVYDPHVLVTDTAIDIWWGGADPDHALVRLRSIPRSEIGL